MPVLVSRHTEGVAIDSILAHSSTVAWARSTFFVICLTESPSVFSGQPQTGHSGSLGKIPPCWQVFPPQELVVVSQVSPLFQGGHWHSKTLSPGVFTWMAILWQGLKNQWSFRSSQSLSKLLALSKQQLWSCRKPLCIQLFWQKLKRSLMRGKYIHVIGQKLRRLSGFRNTVFSYLKLVSI